MKQIGLLGGAFDPPHFAHVDVINNALKSGLIDELWIVPTGGSRYDKKCEASPVLRQEMLNAMIAECFSQKPVRLEPLQITGPLSECGTMELVDALRALHPDCDFSFIIGADILGQLPSWRQSERLMREVKFLVTSRPGKTLHRSAFKSETIVGTTRDISSTAIRSAVRAGTDISALVGAAVQKIIKDKRLYVQAD